MPPLPRRCGATQRSKWSGHSSLYVIEGFMLAIESTHNFPVKPEAPRMVKSVRAIVAVYVEERVGVGYEASKVLDEEVLIDLGHRGYV